MKLVAAHVLPCTASQVSTRNEHPPIRKLHKLYQLIPIFLLLAFLPEGELAIARRSDRLSNEPVGTLRVVTTRVVRRRVFRPYPAQPHKLTQQLAAELTVVVVALSEPAYAELRNAEAPELRDARVFFSIRSWAALNAAFVYP